MLTDRRTGVRSEVFEARWIRCRCCDEGGVLHRASLFECALDRCDSGTLLTDRNVDALDALLRISRFPVLALVDDGVDRNRGLSGLTITDDQLSLTTTDRGHRVDRLDTGCQWLLHRLALDDRRRLKFECTSGISLDLALAIDRTAERIDDAT